MKFCVVFIIIVAILSWGFAIYSIGYRHGERVATELEIKHLEEIKSALIDNNIISGSTISDEFLEKHNLEIIPNGQKHSDLVYENILLKDENIRLKRDNQTLSKLKIGDISNINLSVFNGMNKEQANAKYNELNEQLMTAVKHGLISETSYWEKSRIVSDARQRRPE